MGGRGWGWGRGLGGAGTVRGAWVMRMGGLERCAACAVLPMGSPRSYHFSSLNR